MHINPYEIMETIRMVRMEHLDIRFMPEPGQLAFGVLAGAQRGIENRLRHAQLTSGHLHRLPVTQ